MQRLLLLCLLMGPLAAQAADVKITARVDLGWIEPRSAPRPSHHHLTAPAERARDACTWVAGVRHCPLPPLRAESR